MARAEGLVAEGATVRITLAEGEVIQGVVEHCSATGRSARVRVEGEAAARQLNLQKLPYELVEAFHDADSIEGSSPEGSESGEEGSSGSEGEEESAPSEGEEGVDLAALPDARSSQQASTPEEDYQTPLGGSQQDGSQPESGGAPPPPVVEILAEASASEAERSSEEEGSDGDEDGSEGSERGDDGSGGDGSDSDDGSEVPAPDVYTTDEAEALDAFLAEANPADLLMGAPGIAEGARRAMRVLYGRLLGAVSDSGASVPDAVLPELYVDGFDAEQVWVQLEGAGDAALGRAKRLLRKAGDAPQILSPEDGEALDELLRSQGILSDDGDDSEGEGSGEEEEEEEEEEEGASESDDAPPPSGSSSDAEDEFEAMLRAGDGRGPGDSKAKAAARGKGTRRSSVEDDHFRLDDMERFVREAEEAEARGEDPDAQDDEDSGDEEGFDEAAGEESSEEDEEDEEEGEESLGAGGVGGGKGRRAGVRGDTAMAADFFGPLGGDGADGTRDGSVSRRGKGGKGPDLRGFLDEDDEDEGEASEGGSDDEEMGDAAARRAATNALAGSSDDDEASVEESDGEDGVAAGGRGADGDAGASGGGSSLTPRAPGEGERASAYELRKERLSKRISTMEEELLAEKDWFLRGEAGARSRPLNSALEVDLDFDTTVRTAPAPTVEATTSLEDVIRRRIEEGLFDDPLGAVKVAAKEARKKLPELDDEKSKVGLAELYARDYEQAQAAAGAGAAAVAADDAGGSADPTVTSLVAGGSAAGLGSARAIAEDLDSPRRAEARLLFTQLCSRLDELSHQSYAPAETLEDLAAKPAAQARAIFAEEAVPVGVSDAALVAPEQLHAKPRLAAISSAGGSDADGAALGPRAESELSREDRKRRRAAHKRVGRRRRGQKEEAQAALQRSLGGEVAGGVRSERAERARAAKLVEARTAAKKRQRGRGGAKGAAAALAVVDATQKRGHYTKSTAVFAQLQGQRDAKAAGAALDAGQGAVSAKKLKL